MNARENRYNAQPTEVRARGEGRTIGGYAATFGKVSQNLGGFVEIIDRGFFNKARGDNWPGADGQGVIARFNHEDSELLGRTSSGTLSLTVDEVGLDYSVNVPESRSHVLEYVQRRDVTQSSFAFMTAEDEWGTSDQNFPLRTLVTGQLVDVAPVTHPAYLDTSVAAREAWKINTGVALRSLAAAKDAPIEDVVELAAKNELRKLFVRTDGPNPDRLVFGPAALAAVQARKYSGS